MDVCRVVCEFEMGMKRVSRHSDRSDAQATLARWRQEEPTAKELRVELLVDWGAFQEFVPILKEEPQCRASA